MMKRLTCILAALGILIWTCPPAQARFKGTLQRNQAWQLDFVGAGNGDAAVTVYYLGRELEVIEIMTVPTGGAVSQPFSKPGRGVRRITIEVDPPEGGSVNITIVQGATQTNDVPDSEARLVFDVVNAP